MEAAPIPAWSELPPDLLGQISGVFLSLVDRARFRAVCSSWHSAARHYGPPPPARLQLPWVLHLDGEFQDPNDGEWYCFPSFFPADDVDTAVCVGATDGWVALDCCTTNNKDDDHESCRRHSYSLHNPFSGRTVLLPELDTVIGSVSILFGIRKMLVHAVSDDLVVVFLTNNWNHPMILIRPGKGLWLPKPRTPPFTRIVDIAFLDDGRLYGITEGEDLVSLHADADTEKQHDTVDDAMIGFQRVIRPSSYDDDDDAWSDGDEEGNEKKNQNGDAMLAYDGTRMVHDDDDDGFITIDWYLVESQGKLVMVRRRVMWPSGDSKFTLHVDVFEADLSTTSATWVPAVQLGGQALFISKLSSKSITACGDVVQEGDILFVDTREVFNIKSRTISPSIWSNDIYKVSWIFPELVL